MRKKVSALLALLVVLLSMGAAVYAGPNDDFPETQSIPVTVETE